MVIDRYRDYMSYNEYEEEAAEMGIEALERQRWIPVTERMPEDFENVLIWDKIDNDPFTGHYSKSDGWTIDGWENAPDSTFKITHWMPMPEPPEEGGNGNAAD